MLPLWKPKFTNLGIFENFKFHTLMETILQISLKLNFILNTFGLLWVKTMRHHPGLLYGTHVCLFGADGEEGSNETPME